MVRTSGPHRAEVMASNAFSMFSPSSGIITPCFCNSRPQSKVSISNFSCGSWRVSACKTSIPAEMTSGPIPSAGMAAICSDASLLLQLMSMRMWKLCRRRFVRSGRKNHDHEGRERQQSGDKVQAPAVATGLLADHANHHRANETAEVADGVDSGNARPQPGR